LRGTVDQIDQGGVSGEDHFFDERTLRRAVHEYVTPRHSERNRQRKSNVLLVPRTTERGGEGPMRCRERLGGLLRYYHRDAA